MSKKPKLTKEEMERRKAIDEAINQLGYLFEGLEAFVDRVDDAITEKGYADWIVFLRLATQRGDEIVGQLDGLVSGERTKYEVKSLI